MTYWQVVLMLAGWVASATEYIVRITHLKGWAVRVVAVIIAIISAPVFAMTTPAQEDALTLILWGIGAAIVAGGGKDLLKSILTTIGAPTE